MLLKDRAFTIVAVLALALGIGANTALFTVLSNVLLNPLPFPEAETIVAIGPRHSSGLTTSAYPDFLDLREQSRTFERLGAYRSGSFLVRTENGEPARVRGATVTSDIIPLLGVKPAIGRVFSRSEDEPGSRRVAVISHQMWEEQFAKAPNVTRATLTVDGFDYAIIGVMPAGFQFPIENDPAQFWTTFARQLDPLPDGSKPFPYRRAAHFLYLLGRVKAGVTVEDARRDVNTIAQHLAHLYPETNRNYATYRVTSWLEAITRQVRPALLMLIGAALFTLAVACANVANLLLARASTRRKEIALRMAMGAGRMRILRQLLTESLLLAALGGVSGLLLALAGTRYIVAALPANFPRAGEIAPDAKVLGFALLVTALTSCLFGLAPGWRSAKTRIAPLLNDASTGASDTRRGRRARNTLVVVELVSAFILLGSACFFMDNLARLRAAPLGFDPDNVLSATVSMPNDELPNLSARAALFFAEALDRLAGIDGVESASVVSRLPLSGSTSITDFGIGGRAIASPDKPLSEPHMVAPGYFRTMRVPIIAGRDFNAGDRRDSTPVVIINQAIAERIFPGENPIGKRITPGVFIDSPAPLEREIVGVVGDVRSDMLAAELPMQVYIPIAQCPLRELTLVVRSAEAPHDLLVAIKAVITELHDGVAVAAPMTMEERVHGSVAAPRLNSTLLAAFASVAVVLTTIGVYGVMAYSVAQRRHDIGIRIALGAQKRHVLRLVLGEGVRLIALALALGAALTAMACRCSTSSRLAHQAIACRSSRSRPCC
jgi:putative ABC transport system permease protein